MGLQNDFLPGGAISVPNGDAVILLANQIQNDFKLIVATQDWHPANHVSFAANHPGRAAGEVVKTRKGSQLLWPQYCVQKTRGAELASNLSFNRVNRVFKKGTDTGIGAYSGFYDDSHTQATGMGEFLKSKRVNELFILGLATDYAVKFTALDAVGLGFKTYVYEDACRGLELKTDDVAKAIKEMTAAGVEMIQSNVPLPVKRK